MTPALPERPTGSCAPSNSSGGNRHTMLPSLWLSEQPFLSQKNQAKHKGEGKRRVPPRCSRSREMQNMTRAPREAKAGRPGRDARPERTPAQRQNESPDGSAAGDRAPGPDRSAREAAEERHGTVQVMVRDRVQTAGPLQKRKIVRHQASPQEQRA